MKFGDFLIENGFASKNQVAKALRYQRIHKKLLGLCLVDLQYFSESDLITILKYKRELKK